MRGDLLEMDDVRALMRARGLDARKLHSAAITGALKADVDAQRDLGRRVLWFTRNEVERWLNTIEQLEG